MRRYGLLFAIALFALVGFSAQAATSAHKTVICHATKAGVSRPYVHITTANRAYIRAHRNRHPADVMNPVGGLCPKQRLTWSRGAGRSPRGWCRCRRTPRAPVASPPSRTSARVGSAGASRPPASPT